LDSPEFLTVSDRVLTVVIERDAFPVDEADLFKSVIKWSIASLQIKGLEVTPSNQRKIMGSFIHRIRFLIMTRVDFATNVFFTDILSENVSEECKEILRCISSGDKDEQVFDFKPRKSSFGFASYEPKPLKSKRSNAEWSEEPSED